MLKPITPEKAREIRSGNFPDWIIEAVNKFIVKNMRGDLAFTIKQKDIMEEALRLAPDGTRSQTVYDNGWMDIEPLYRENGWTVSYSSPAMDESWDVYFTFKPAA